MDPIIWAVLLMVLGLALMLMEIFIPSGGILGFLAVCAMVGSVGMAFYYGGPATGFIFVVVAVVGLPVVVVGGLKMWPHTPMGRRMLLDVPQEEENDTRSHLLDLMHHFGTTKVDMLPGGTVKIEGKTYEAVSESGPIDRGESVEVVDVQNARLVVRQAEAPPPQSPDDVLSQPLDTVGLDPFEDPLG